MKATLKLELFGDNTRQQLKFYTNLVDAVCGPKGFGETILGGMPNQSWVAEIKGEHPKYKYDREFLRSKKDYTNTNSNGSRGIFAWYVLESGKCYEIKAQTSWRNIDRYFAKVDETGDIVKVDEDEVLEWLKSR